MLLERTDTHTRVRKRVFERNWEPNWEPRGFIEFIDVFIREKISWREQQKPETETRDRNQRQKPETETRDNNNTKY
jgi:hypothetical protein